MNRLGIEIGIIDIVFVLQTTGTGFKACQKEDRKNKFVHLNKIRTEGIHFIE
jgi:hypothetical protein